MMIYDFDQQQQQGPLNEGSSTDLSKATTTTTTTATTSITEYEEIDTSFSRPSMRSVTPVTVHSTSTKTSTTSTANQNIRISKTKNNKFYDDEGWTLNKLRYSDLGLHGRQKEIGILQQSLQRVCCGDNNNINNKQQQYNTTTAPEDAAAAATSHPPSPSVENGSSSFTSSSSSRSSSINEFVLISGYSGTGKTTLAVTSLQKTVKQKGGLLVKGKFDLELRNQPHAGIIQVCKELSAYIVTTLRLSNPILYKATCEEICERLAETSNHFRTVTLTEFIPDMKAFMDESNKNNAESILKNNNVEKREKETEVEVNRKGVNNIDQQGSREFEADDKNRLYHAIQIFFAAVASSCSPVVVVLDDLQWADSGSLDFLELLLKSKHEQQQKALMVIGCYRSNEVHDQHILSTMLREIRETNNKLDHLRAFQMTEISLGNLQLPDVNNVLMDLLGIDDESGNATLGLARIVHRRTDGNAFFLISFVSMLQEQGLLEYNFGLMKWVWSDTVVEEKTVATTNVVDMIRTKMLAQSHNDVEEMLKLAAFLGTTFKEQLIDIIWREFFQQGNDNKKQSKFATSTTATASTTTTRSSHEILLAAADQLFLEQLQTNKSGGSPSYRWVHDKVQEAALSLVHPNEINNLKYKIGRILMDQLTDDMLQESIFVVCSLLNSGSSMILSLDRKMKISIANLNLQACQKAIRSSAFEIAARFAVKGIEILPKEDCWESNKELTLELYSTAVLVENITGQTEKMWEHSNIVLGQKNCSFQDKLEGYHALVENVSEQDGPAAGNKLCLDVLNQMGCRFPKSFVFIMLATIRGLLRAQKQAKHIDADSLFKMNFKKMKYEDILQMRLLNKSTNLCYQTDSPLMGLIGLRMFQLANENGFSAYSPIAYSAIAVMMVVGLSDFEAGLRYADLSLELVKTMKLQRVEARCLFLANIMVYHWSRPVVACLKPLMRAYEIGLQSGDTESSISAIINYCTFSFVAGKPLAHVAENFAIFRKQGELLKKESHFIYNSPISQLVLNLLGQSDNTTVLTGVALTEDDFYKEGTPSMSLATLLYCKVVACIYFDKLEEGATLAMEKEDMSVAVPGWAPTALDPLYRALLLVFLARKMKKEKKNSNKEKRKLRSYKRKAKGLLAKPRKWTKQGNPNLIHMLSLVEAELAALDKESEIAKNHYQRSVVIATRGGIIHEAALANERFGYFLLDDMKDMEGAKVCFHDAIRLYSEWGAEHKVERLRTMINPYMDLC